jgi:hypothetical protein
MENTSITFVAKSVGYRQQIPVRHLFNDTHQERFLQIPLRHLTLEKETHGVTMLQ